MKKILVLNGPNLNRVGRREPALYGDMTLEALESMLIERAKSAGVKLSCFQTNSESSFIEAIHQAVDDLTDFLIINAAAYTHTSVAIRDALLTVQIPFIEVHITNIFARETFRHHSYLSDIALGVITGLGVDGYCLALQAILSKKSL